MDGLEKTMFVKKNAFIVTGGCGYLASKLVQQLLGEHHEFGKYKFIMMDIVSPSKDLELLYSKGDVAFVQVDIGSAKDVGEAVSRFSQQHNVVGVFHTAAYGFCGSANLPAHDPITERTNIVGTLNMLEACIDNDIECFVFTSSVNVAFQGVEIINGDEKSNKWLVGNDSKISHLDTYSRTKQEGEKITLRAEGRKLRKGRCQLKTCILRLGGVYGPGEIHLTKRSLDHFFSIFNHFNLDTENTYLDFVHVENANQAHIKAMEALMDRNDKIAGEIFYVTDGRPVNPDFPLKILKEVLPTDIYNVHSTAYHLSPLLVKLVALFFHAISLLLGPAFKLPDFGITWMEIHKITVTHYFSIEKAKWLLGYRPKTIEEKDLNEIRLQVMPLMSKYQEAIKKRMA